ncbi:MAG: septal ring lytic transglycosylase RlpA family lipoprotein [Desulfuromonas sp.]|nr:MAG: septal ring lytic transglycosylase RlpA family lipoprotein [Desulfuromonas sp.]
MLIFLLLLLVTLMAGCGGGQPQRNGVIETAETQGLPAWQKPYQVDGQRYDPMQDHQGFEQRGIASWYGGKFHGRKTSNGETYDMYGISAAHKTLPLGVYVKVTHLETGRQLVVRINDRGPFVAGRIIDLSYGAAQQLGIVDAGTAPVLLEALGYRESTPQGQVVYRAPVNYDSGRFAVQIGAFAAKENAYRLADRMRAEHGRAVVIDAEVNGRQMFRVRVGDYSSLDRADQAAAQFAGNGFPGSFVVALD